ncbi:MAG: 8-oxo-dGTP diphosphatase MutT [Pseudomonadota bacterium]
MNKPSIRVAAGVLRRNRQVLIAQRLDGQHGAGLWEFPGGKLEPGESPEHALERELLEELGVVVTGPIKLREYTYTYPERHIHFTFFLIDDWQGEPRGAEGQAVRWVEIDQLQRVEWLPANISIMASLAEHLDPCADR